MSLKAFHTFFIVVCFMFSTYFGGWCFSQYLATEGWGMLAMAFGSFLAATSLAFYLVWFLKKYKEVGFLAIAYCLFGSSQKAWACAVCFGDPNSPMVQSVNSGVWFLLAVISSVLVGFACLFLFWQKRAAQIKF